MPTADSGSAAKRHRFFARLIAERSLACSRVAASSIRVHAYGLPRGRQRAGCAAADYVDSQVDTLDPGGLYQPHQELAGYRVKPENVACAVAVEVAGFLDLPGGRRRQSGRGGEEERLAVSG